MDTHAAAGETRSERRGIEMRVLSRAMVRLYKERFGRGPTKAQSVYATADLLICTLENSLTPAERTMADLGEHQRLRDIRMFFQHASEKRVRRSRGADHRPSGPWLREWDRHRA